MGTLTLKMMEFRANRAPGHRPTVATAILRWEVRTKRGKKKSGFALETYKLQGDGRIILTKDATV